MKNSSITIFIAVFTGIMLLMSWLIYFRYIKKLQLPPICIWGLKILFFYGLISIIAYVLKRSIGLPDMLNIPIIYGMGVFFLLGFYCYILSNLTDGTIYRL